MNYLLSDGPAFQHAPGKALRSKSCSQDAAHSVDSSAQLLATVAGLEDVAGEPAAAAAAWTTGWLCTVPTPAAVGAGLLVAVALAWKLLGSRGPSRPLGPLLEPRQFGPITLSTLATYCGKDPFRQTLVAVRGRVMDVTKARNELFAPDRPLHVYAGREISRALALGSVALEDCNDDLSGLAPEELARLEEEEARLMTEYKEVGQVVAPQMFTLAELGRFDGSDPSKPLYLAIRGQVYDITTGKMYYGPNGIYPFAGREVARAFALNSLKDSDCTSNLEGLTRGDMNNLAEWEAKFNYKYPIIGVVEERAQETATDASTGSTSTAATA